MADDKDAAAPQPASPIVTTAPARVTPGADPATSDELQDAALDAVVGGCCSGKHLDT